MDFSRDESEFLTDESFAVAHGASHLLDDLYHEADHRLAQRLCPKGRVALFGAMDSTGRVIQDWARGQSASLVVVEAGDTSAAWVLANAQQLDCLFVDSDHLGDQEDTVDFCMRVRRKRPDLKIVLISSEVRNHDLTCERMMACDATIKWPATRQNLAMGLSAAKGNHSKFLAARGLDGGARN